jgi:hypothetical protein
MADQAWIDRANAKIAAMPEGAKEIRDRGLADLWYFAKLVNPKYVYGDVHKFYYKWLSKLVLFEEGLDEESNNKLIMLPRAHLKSHMVATAVAWLITKHPEVSVLYLSATSQLAEIQLSAIKTILQSDTYTRYYPDYIHPEEGKRSKWTGSKIDVDHPKRDSEGVRDHTVACAGLTTNTTGWHADVIVSDDIVIPENAYTREQREQVKKKVSQFTSIRNPGGFTLACGTRYHPADIYGVWAKQTYKVYDNEGLFIAEYPVWEIEERVVETDGLFLWPRTTRADGKAFGFNQNVLARIYAEYEDKEQYFAQYYNNPNKLGAHRITSDLFQYYEQRHIAVMDNIVYFKDKKLNVCAAIDFAFSLKKEADYSAIAVVGMDWQGDTYILDIARFKTNKIGEYFREIIALQTRWEFRKLIAEVTAAQEVIVEDLKDYVSKEGRKLSIVPFRPDNKKEERISAILDFRYEDQQVWHFKGGLTPVLEEELLSARPPHDDVKDVLAVAVSNLSRPSSGKHKNKRMQGSQINSRFGGRKFK